MPQYHPLPPHSDLVVFTISPFGAIGPQGSAFLRYLSRCAGGAVPSAMLDEASWATPTLGDFARMAVTLAARRALALSIRQTWGARRAFSPAADHALDGIDAEGDDAADADDVDDDDDGDDERDLS